jgi:hypothetical protein
MTILEKRYWLQGFNAGRQETEARIKARIWDRVADLNSCDKSDCNCGQMAYFIESYIPEWFGEDETDE